MLVEQAKSTCIVQVITRQTSTAYSPSVLCIIIFLRLCFALLEEVPLTICEGGLHNPPATTSL